MTPGIGLALLSMLCFGACDFIYKRAALAGGQSRHFLMLQAWVFCPLVTLYAAATGNLDVHASAVWGALAGLLAFTAFYNFAQSLRTGSVSTNASIFRLNFTGTAVLAILLLGEAVTLWKVAGLLLALASAWLLLSEPQQESMPTRAPASLARVLVATAALAIANLSYKIGLQHGAKPETLLSAQAWVFCSLATSFVVLIDRRLTIRPTLWRYSGPAAVLLATGFILLLHGLAVGQASVLVPVAQLGFVTTALLAVVLLGEALSGRKLIGLATAAVALACFAAG